MALTSSDTLVNTPRSRRSVVMSRKNLSTMFSHDAEVGVKCMLNSRLLGQPILHGGVLVRGVVVGDQMQGLALGRLAIDLEEELQRARAATCTGLRCLRASRQTADRARP